MGENMMFSSAVLTEMTLLLAQEFWKQESEHDAVWAENFKEGATLFIKELFPLIILKCDDKTDVKAQAMVEGVAYMATQTAWLIKLRIKDWKEDGPERKT
jgi:hypothetical protein